MNSYKRILVVDDEEHVLFVLQKGLKKLDKEFVVETAQSGFEALEKVRKKPFDLIVTDLRMQGMDGLEVMEQARALQPHTRLILMTAFGDSQIEATAYRLGACRYIDKPFEFKELAVAVRAALTEAKSPGRDILVLADEQFDAIAQCLSALRFEVGAQCILLADVTGQMVAHVGEAEGLDLQTLISLVGGGFATAFEMARYLRESEALTLNYHEGERYDVYSSNVNKDLFLLLIFDKQQQHSRLGMVWLYTKRTLKQLQDLVKGAKRVNADQVLDADFGSLLSDSMDQLFAGSAVDERASQARSPSPTSSDVLPSPTTKADDDQAPKEISPEPIAVAVKTTETFGLQQALEMGLLDPSWIEGAENDRD